MPMQAYFFILIAALFFSGQFVFTKFYEKGTDGSLRSNLWMSEFYGFWLIAIFLTANGFHFEVEPITWLFSALTALCGVGCTAASIAAYRRGKMTTVTLYMLIGGQAVPFIYGILTGSNPSALCWIGFALMLLSFLPGILGKKQTVGSSGDSDSDGNGNANANGGAATAVAEKKADLPYYLLCLACFFCNGFVSVLTTLKATKDPATGDNDFLVLNGICYLLLISVLLLLLGVIDLKKGTPPTQSFFGGIAKKTAPLPILLAALIVGGYALLNGLGNVFSLQAAGSAGMSADVHFPLLNSMIVVFTPILSRLFFKEKQSPRDLAGIALAALGILFFLLDFLMG